MINQGDISCIQPDMPRDGSTGLIMILGGVDDRLHSPMHHLPRGQVLSGAWKIAEVRQKR